MECKFKVIYEMKKPSDIPYSLPSGLEKEFYVEFYMHACKILKQFGHFKRYDMCKKKLNELIQSEK